MDRQEKISVAQQVFEEEIATLRTIQESIDDNFIEIEEAITSCKGKVVMCGMGKSGHIARKISATFASLGTPSFFLHPAEAMHGDLGMVSENDVVVLLSNSGETQEILSIIPSLKLIGAKLIGITGCAESTLAKECEINQVMDIEKEACYLNLAPTSSTTAMLVYGDALAVTVSEEQGFSSSNFGLFHPAGTLGKKVLLKVEHIMAQGEELPLVVRGCKITDTIIEMSKKGLGTVAVVDEENKLIGLVTDGDLRRAIEKKVDVYKDVVDSIMTKNPRSIPQDILLVDALKRLKESRLNNYPVVDDSGKVIGMLTWQMIIREGIAL
jgi:arabinose-5-phosphate isomerase